MTAYKGRIFGKSVLEATFRSFYGTDLFLGELLAAEDAERARRFLFRVIQVAYGSESSDPGWSERTAGAYMAGDAAGSPYTLHDPEQRLYKVATCQPLGYIDAAGEFRKPKSLPAQFARVTAPTPQDFAFLHERMGDLRIGLLRSGEDTIDLEVGIKGETLTSHVGVFATTGMGKSNLMKVLAGQILVLAGAVRLSAVRPARRVPRGRERDPSGPARASLGRRPPARLRDASLGRGGDHAPPVARRAHARRPADGVRVEPRAGGRDLPADPFLPRGVDRPRRGGAGRERPRRAARGRHEHAPGDPAPGAADPGHAVHLARSVAALAVRAHRRRADGRLLGPRRHERAVLDGGDPRGLGHHAAGARRLRLGLPGRPRPVRRAAADADRARGGPAGAVASDALGRERLPAGGPRGAQVQGRPVRRRASSRS